jgi:hypothetical protein
VRGTARAKQGFHGRAAQCAAWPGKANKGKVFLACQCDAIPGRARQCKAWHGVANKSKARFSVHGYAWHGKAVRGSARQRKQRHGFLGNTSLGIPRRCAARLSNPKQGFLGTSSAWRSTAGQRKAKQGFPGPAWHSIALRSMATRCEARRGKQKQGKVLLADETVLNLCYHWTSPKVCYVSASDARSQRVHLQKRQPNKTFEVFKCRHCGSWHIGKRRKQPIQRLRGFTSQDNE